LLDIAFPSHPQALIALLAAARGVCNQERAVVAKKESPTSGAITSQMINFLLLSACELPRCAPRNFVTDP
jgi:hypothetical protein